MDGLNSRFEKPIVYIVSPSCELLECVAIAANESQFIPLAYEEFDRFEEFFDEMSPGCILIATANYDAVAIEQMCRIFSRSPSAQIALVLSIWSMADIVRAVQQGVSDLLSSGDSFETIALAIGRAITRDDVCRSRISNDLPHRIRVRLDDHEARLLSQIIQGRTTKQIVTELDVSARTIHYRKKSIYSKIGVQDRNEAIEVCRQHRKAEASLNGWHACLPMESKLRESVR